jgi:CNT family concentrative nucleoside transporter
MVLHAVSATGVVALLGIAWLFSEDRRHIQWRGVAWGVALQLVIGLLIFRLPGSRSVLLALNSAVLALLDASRSGSTFLFGPLAAMPGEKESIGFILLFQVLPVAIFFSAVTAALYHIGVLQIVVRLFARLFHRTLGTSGAESLCGAANIFVGVESALVIRPYLERLTRSELLTVLTTGMATVASSTLGIYVAFLSGVFPQIAGHLLSASVLSIPAAVITTKILVPETGVPETLARVPSGSEVPRARNLMAAIIEGSMDGLRLAAGISALLIAMLGIVALIDLTLAVAARWMGASHPPTLAALLGWAFYPFAALLGIAPADLGQAAKLLGQRIVLTEVVSYQELARGISNGLYTDPRSVVILSYALCGFAHIASVAIFVGGTAALAPSRRDDLASLGMRALLAATIATLMTGAVAGIFSTGQGVLLTR